MLKRLPLGLQDFRKLREEDCLYVDKTELICQLANKSGYYFLSRPRRFGKSLLTSTLKELYSGDKALFKGLWAENNWDWNKQNPVIHIAFNAFAGPDIILENALLQEVEYYANAHGLSLASEGLSRRFSELLERIHEKTGKKVVVLIDEYDKPIVDYLDELDKAKLNRTVLKGFYGALKPADPHIEFCFITGVSKFSKVSIFSDLNNLKDLTLNPRFGALCGYTQVELERDFEPYIDVLSEAKEINKEECLALLREWYNGYNFGGKERVYNPWSILNCLDDCIFKNYWFISGTPTFLIKILKDKFYSNLEDVEMGELALESYDLENMQIEPLLFQTGYLTIKSQEGNLFTLTYPNREVKDAMLQHLIGAFRHEAMGNTVPLVAHLRKAFRENDLPKIISVINTAFASIPYQLFEAQSEAYYHALIHLLFTYLGLDVRSEVANIKGRLDAIVHTDTHIYIFEFKLNKSADIALAQIIDNGYDQPYRHSGKELVLVGVNFDGKEKCVLEDGWKVGS